MSENTGPSLSRRGFLRGQFLNTLKSEQVTLQGHQAIRPPWANLANFLEKCTACGRCVEVCETKIIKQGVGGYPEIDFTRGECTFCTECVKVCPEDVFLSLDEPAWLHKIEILDQCLLKQRIECRSCGDYCPERAIRFRPTLGGIATLQMDLTACNGCGACLNICPTKAIRIINFEVNTNESI
ncbi:ferredoxin-type protein NapF [Haemophilus sputorum]|uniref:ferredoxin-type protein NapF n=1 Tax=Haemophilus sputorum TaxID=1078480 RepID=UPI0028D27B39|nr:ferredoxin-type protein NapF [Haemophilus sputorum]